ncbi:MAG: NFACT family protein [Clostridia bacterium]|nr:NFACT family protein [Clostridia bacterium]
MAFDSGMMAAALHEIREQVGDARIEKINQPGKDEIILSFRTQAGAKKLLISAGSNTPRICLSEVTRENPSVPPMFCTLLRKYLSGAKLTKVEQPDFERVARLEFETHDEMGYLSTRYLVAEIMGRYSNLILLDGTGAVMQALRPVDFTTSRLRQVLPGMQYEMPPSQDKTNPLNEDGPSFIKAFKDAPADMPADKWLLKTFSGFSPVLSREVVFRAAGKTDEESGRIDGEKLAREFLAVTDLIKNGRFEPCLVLDGKGPVEYSFLPLTQYGRPCRVIAAGAGSVLDRFYEDRDRAQLVHQRAADILQILTHAKSRLVKKMELQTAERKECARGAEYKKAADLITANIHLISHKEKTVTLTDYEDWREDGTYGTVTLELDERLSPAANAQKMYKKYAKCKKAEVELARQLELGQVELSYIESVLDELGRAETVTDLNEIREELFRSGYGARMKNACSATKNSGQEYMAFRTDRGHRILCGRNNLQNEHITHKLAEKTDYWFHVKNRPGSHVVLLCGKDEPQTEEFTQAAEIAAYYSSARGGSQVPVDYTPVKNLHKVTGARPGFVIYHTNRTAYVTPDKERIEAAKEN